MKTGRKVATAEEFSVAKGENLVANATNTVAMSSPEVKSSPLCTFVQNRSYVFATSCLENGVGEGQGETLPQMRNKAGRSS